MRLRDLFNLEAQKVSRKRKALRKVLAKLDRTHDALTGELQSDASGTSRKRLETRLKTNQRHREKARRLIADLDRRTAGSSLHSGLTG